MPVQERTWTTVEPINARSMLDAATAAAAAATADRPPVERRRRLSQAALAVTNQKVRRAYSPVVIAGAVRVADFVLLSLVGVALYLGYVVPLSGFHWRICRGDFRHDRDRGDLLPGLRHLRSAGVSRPAPADDADDFILGVRVPAVHRRIVLRKARQRNIAAVALGVFLLRPGGADRRTPVPAHDGARLGA